MSSRTARSYTRAKSPLHQRRRRGDYALVNTNTESSDPDGMALPTIGTDGVVVVVDGAAIAVGSAVGQPAGIVPIDVVLFTNLEVATTQNEIAVGPGLAITTDEFGEPDCTVNPDIGKGSTTFTFQPSGCLPGEDCTSMQARVDGPDSTPIPSGSVLYTCTVEIASDVSTGEIPLRNTNPLASDPNGDPLLTIGTDGVVIVSTEATIAIGSSVGQPGSTVFIDVVLSTELAVASTQNDIVFRPQARVSVTDLGAPDCAINPTIGAGDATFSFEPSDCMPQNDCTAVRAHVEGLAGILIPVDSVLYSCAVEIAADAVGAFPLACVNAAITHPAGGTLEANCTTGHVVVGSEPGDAVIIIESVAGAEPGSLVRVGVSLLGREDIAGTQNDITFAAEAAIIADEGGRARCVLNPRIDLFGTFTFWPPGCTVEATSAATGVGVVTCTGIRVFLFSPSLDTIPSGSVLYTCTVATAPDAAGVFPLTCSGQGASDPAGNAIQTDCIDGEVEVGASILTPAFTPVPPTPTPGTSGSCQVGTPANIQMVWLLLFPVAILVWLRRCTAKY